MHADTLGAARPRPAHASRFAFGATSPAENPRATERRPFITENALLCAVVLTPSGAVVYAPGVDPDGAGVPIMGRTISRATFDAYEACGLVSRMTMEEARAEWALSAEAGEAPAEAVRHA